MDRRLRLAAFTALAVGLSLACGPREATPQTNKPAPSPGGDAVVVAEVGGTPITEADLDTWIRDDLFQRETANKGKAELYEFRSDALQRMIDERLLEAEAAKEKLTVDQLLAQQAKGTAVTDDAVKAFYDQNKARMGSATLEQISPRIRRFLEEREANDARETYVASLRKKAAVEVKLEAPRVKVAADGPSRGKPDAPVTIIEFSDYQCPFCKRAESVVQEVLKKYPDQVRLVYRNFPLEQIHPHARPAAEAALCANEQGKFWEFHDKVFAGNGLEDSDLAGYATAVGIDPEKFKACVAERRFKDQVDADAKAGREAGVSGTPAFFVNGILISGAKPIEEFSALIDRELKNPKKGS